MLVNPLFLVIKLPVSMDPIFSSRQRNLFPFLEILHDRKSCEWLARITLDTDHLEFGTSIIALSSSRSEAYLASDRRQHL